VRPDAIRPNVQLGGATFNLNGNPTEKRGRLRHEWQCQLELAPVGRFDLAPVALGGRVFRAWASR
jgi:hypothetical protein